MEQVATTIQVLGTKIKLSATSQLLEAITAASADKPVRIATPNPEFILLALKDAPFNKALGSMTHHTVDGFGLLLALKLIARKKRVVTPIEKYTGADLCEDLFKQFQNGEKRFALLGGLPGSAQAKRAALQKQYPNIAIPLALHGGVITTDKPLNQDLLAEIATAKPDILLVGFGAPKQEIWIQAASKHSSLKSIPVMIGVGGTLDFGVTKRRSPRTFQKLHLEWLWRSLTEKGHVKRAYQATMVFSLKVLRSLIKLASR